jgi:hypothetical protein
MRTLLALLCLPLLCLSACATFPEVDREMTATADAPPPQLLPTETLLAQADRVLGAQAAQADLQARAAALRARAARIRAMPVT